MAANRPSPRRQVPQHRRGLYYLGMALTGLGLLLFLSTFVTACSGFGDFTDFDNRAKPQFGTALTGMVLAMIGGVLQGIGRRGLAGAGVLLDPERAREDLEPWSRMTGGMVKDALDEAGVARRVDDTSAQPAIKVRCLGCKALNDEHDRFCGQCGKPLGA